ncbi:MAG: PAS domain S-box protein [Spirochaetaceae bacterium]|nr:MAG: PAS domain S-box protein [Spirochaetaceae bacterium]
MKHKPGFASLACFFLLLFTAREIGPQSHLDWFEPALFENHGAIMLLIDPADGAIVAANQAAHEFYSFSDLMNRSIAEINLLTEAEVAAEMLLAASEERNYFYFRHATRDRGVRDVEVYSYPVVIAEAPHLYSIVFDITDRLAAETRLQRTQATLTRVLATGAVLIIGILVLLVLRIRKRLESTEISLRETGALFQSYVENAPLAVFVADQNGRYRDVNPEACRITGYTPEELRSMAVTDLIVEEHLDTARNHFMQVATAGRATTEVEFRTKSGERRWWSVIASRVNSELFVGISEDITARKRRERALQLLSEASVTLQSAGADTIDLADMAHTAQDISGASGVVVQVRDHIVPRHVNRAAVGSADEQSGIPTVIPITHDQQAIGELLLYVSSHEQIRQRPFLYIYAGMIGVTLRRIMTERENRALVAEKENLLKEVQHRIKNNMNTMTSLLSLQQQSLNDPLSVRAINDARSRFQSMQVLYSQLYRTEHHDSGSVFEYLQSLVHQVVRLFPNADHVHVQIDGPDDLGESGDMFRIDAKRLSTVGLIVNELVTNAMKYAFPNAGKPGQGSLRVTVSCPNESIRIEIADNGPGMDCSPDDDSESGFGLTMVRALVEQLRGSIQFANVDGGNDTGTTIVLEFPRVS